LKITAVESSLSVFTVDYYLRQVNEVNGGDNVFVGLCVSLCLHSLHSEPATQTVGELNANSSKMVKATVFLFQLFDNFNMFRGTVPTLEMLHHWRAVQYTVPMMFSTANIVEHKK